MANTKPLLVQNEEYTQRLQDWEQCRAAIAGKNEVVKIITQLPSPLYNNYSAAMNGDDAARAVYMQQQQTNTLRMQSYWARGRYFNAVGRTKVSLQGMLWSKPPEVELPTRIDYIKDNANGGGVSLNDYVREVTDEILTVGRFGALVDMPQRQDGKKPTVAEIENGFSARFVPYRTESAFYARVCNKTNALVEVRLFEPKEIAIDEYNFKTVKYVRRLIIIDGVYINQLYDDECVLVDEVAPKANGKTLGYIPFLFFGAQANTVKIDNPPLYDLAQVNLGHFVLDCDNRDNLHYHGQGMTNVYTKMSPSEFQKKNPAGLDVGAKGRNMFDEGDRVEILQVEATGAIPSEMLRDEQRLISLGAQLVQDVNTNVTLGAKEMEFGASVSQLKQISYNVSEGVTQLLKWADVFMGGNGEDCSYKQNTDFVIDALTPEMLNHFFASVQAGALPVSVYYEALRKTGATKLDDDEIRDKIEDEEDITGESEEMARLRAELEALKMQGADE